MSAVVFLLVVQHVVRYVFSLNFDGDLFASSSSNKKIIISKRSGAGIESIDDADVVTRNVTRITGKLSMTGTFPSKQNVFNKLRIVHDLDIFDLEHDSFSLTSLLYIKGNLTIRNSDALLSRNDFFPSLRIIRGSFVYIETRSSSSSLSIQNSMTNLEKVGQNFGIHAGVHRIESTAFPSLESVGGSFLINATKSLEVLEIGCFRNMFHIGRDFTVFAESIRHISNFMALQTVEGNLNLNATTNLRSLDGLQNLRRVGSNNITFGSPDLKDGAQFGKCGKITQTNNTTAYSIQHACFYDNYKWCQSMLIPNAYRCVSSIATKIIKNRNLRKFARILEISGELMRLQAIQKAITLFAPIDDAFLFLRSSLREQNGGNRSEYDDFSFSSEQATLRNVARAHMFDAIDPSMILSGVKSKFISKLGEKEALKILLSRDRDSSTGAHALLVHRKALSSLLRSVSIIDKHVCDSFSFRKVSTKNALFSKYCDDSTLSARTTLRPIDIVPYDEATEVASTNVSFSSLNTDVTPTTCLNRCGSCDNIELKTCCCDDACMANGDCCGDFSYFCSIQYFLSRQQKATTTTTTTTTTNNVEQRYNAFGSSRNFAYGETEREALILTNGAHSHNGMKLILVDRILHPIGRYHSSLLLLFEDEQGDSTYEEYLSESLPPPPPPPRPPPAPRRVTQFSWLYQTRPPPPTTSVDIKSPPPPEVPSTTTSLPPPQIPPPQPQNTHMHIGSCIVQSPNICGLCDYTDESNVCCCDSMCVSTGDCCSDYIASCV